MSKVKRSKNLASPSNPHPGLSKMQYWTHREQLN